MDLDNIYKDFLHLNKLRNYLNCIIIDVEKEHLLVNNCIRAPDPGMHRSNRQVAT